MTFPQPRTPPQVLSYQDQFRLKTPLQSPGDLYELESNFKALVLGPDSDLGTLQIVYYDDQVQPSCVNTFNLTPQYPFAGRFLVRPDQVYPLSNRKARILVSSQDVYDPNYKPKAFNGDGGDKMSFIVPILDVIGYFQNPPSSLPTKRNDKSYFYQYPTLGSAVTWIVVPYYDRKYAFVDGVNYNNTGGGSMTILGVNFSTTDNNGSNTSYHQETTLMAATAINTGDHVTRIISAASDGMFDALVLGMSSDVPFSIRVYLSDEPISASSPQAARIVTAPVMV